MLVSLSTPDAVALSRVGGKAASLIRLQQAGFEVPAGVVLTTRFFEPWLSELLKKPEWLAVLEPAPRACRQLVAKSNRVSLNL
jgi:phosphoenolpyruvate synthase/pyruvate phosphate dikinase